MTSGRTGAQKALTQLKWGLAFALPALMAVAVLIGWTLHSVVSASRTTSIYIIVGVFVFLALFAGIALVGFVGGLIEAADDHRDKIIARLDTISAIKSRLLRDLTALQTATSSLYEGTIGGKRFSRLMTWQEALALADAMAQSTGHRPEISPITTTTVLSRCQAFMAPTAAECAQAQAEAEVLESHRQAKSA